MRWSAVFCFNVGRKSGMKGRSTDRRRRVMGVPCIAQGQASFGWEEGHYFQENKSESEKL